MRGNVDLFCVSYNLAKNLSDIRVSQIYHALSIPLRSAGYILLVQIM